MMSQEQFNYQRVEKAIAFLSENFKQQPSLEQVAEEVNVSPFHFQRIFAEWAGVSPKRFLQYLTVDFLRNKIQDTQNLVEAAEIAGLSTQSRVYDLFVNIEGVTPQQYKSAGMGLDIYYGYNFSPFGMCFIAVAEKGICGLAFVEEDQKRDEFAQFSKKWSFARLIHQPSYTQHFIQKIFSPFKNQDRTKESDKLTLLVQGTNFQLKVWEALLKVPIGAVSTYQSIAQAIGKPQALRAVGTAVGDNPIAYLIPCHRVIRKEGKLGEYHWGSNRKKAIIGWEMAKAEN
ncbi:MAG: methylated-DNA--[protein]-cysteine S-methyltransferase [Microscillaceae bacterium]|nr:methylated-DNA--[protein]-cysteine S-methyltransferase [Microscillaceae bacterium]